MRGYIALSRVTSASCVLVAQPFNPLLFRQGPQPFPSLLFDTMMGKVTDKDLMLRCEKAEEESKQTKFLADAVWRCGTFQQEGTWKIFFPQAAPEKVPEKDSWYDLYKRYIVSKGCLRQCASCRHDVPADAPPKVTLQYDLCREYFGKDGFSPGQRLESEG